MPLVSYQYYEGAGGEGRGERGDETAVSSESNAFVTLRGNGIA